MKSFLLSFAMLLAWVSSPAQNQTLQSNDVGALEPVCTISDAHIATVIDGRSAELEFPDCSVALQNHVLRTMRDVSLDYESLFNRLHLDSPSREALTRLIAADQLMDGGWSTGAATASLTHARSSSDSASRRELDAQLRSILPASDRAALLKHKEGMPGRFMLRPIASRLARNQVPLTPDELDALALRVTRHMKAGHLNAVKPTTQSALERCQDSHRGMNDRDKKIFALLSEELSETQVESVRKHYDKVFEQRRVQLQRYTEQLANDDAEICSVRLY